MVEGNEHVFTGADFYLFCGIQSVIVVWSYLSILVRSVNSLQRRVLIETMQFVTEGMVNVAVINLRESKVI